MVNIGDLRKVALELDQKRSALLGKLMSDPAIKHCIEWYAYGEVRKALAKRKRK